MVVWVSSSPASRVRIVSLRLWQVMQFSTRNPTNTSLPGLSLHEPQHASCSPVATPSPTRSPQRFRASVRCSACSRSTVASAPALIPTSSTTVATRILLTVDPTHLGASTQAQLVAVGGGTNGLSTAGVNAIKCLGLQAAISDATCTAAQSALAGITT